MAERSAAEARRRRASRVLLSVGLAGAVALLGVPAWRTTSLDLWHWLLLLVIVVTISGGWLLAAWPGSPLPLTGGVDHGIAGSAVAALGLFMVSLFGLADVLGLGTPGFGVQQGLGFALGVVLLVVGLAAQTAPTADERSHDGDGGAGENGR